MKEKERMGEVGGVERGIIIFKGGAQNYT